jgi:hypothetical protein
MACASAADPLSPTAASADFSVPPQFDLWWRMTESCSGRSGDLGKIHWQVAPGAYLSIAGTDTVVAEWTAAGNRIVVTQDAMRDPAVVRHEMLHALLGVTTHPAAAFRDSCGGYVNCVDSCAREVGAMRPADQMAPRMSATLLRVTQQIAPAQVSLSSGTQGWFALILEVTNPMPYAVWARLKPEDGNPGAAATFGYATARGANYSYVAGDSVSFGAGETKRVVFDLTAQSTFAANGKSTEIRAFFNSNMAPSITVGIVQ